MNIKYIGPYEAVDVPSLRLVVEHGHTIEIPDEAAQGFLEQTTNWKKAAASKQTKGDDAK